MIWWGVGLMLVGVLLAVVGGAFFIGTAGSRVVAAFTAPVRATPADFTIDLDEGTYVVYELTGGSRGSGAITATVGRPVTITPSDVEVISASGESLPVEAPTFSETIDRGNGTFTGAARFTVVDPGVHRIKVFGGGQQIVVAPSIAGSFGGAIAWLALVGIGGLIALIGLILLIVGLVRGRRPTAVVAVVSAPAAPSATTPALPAPGWFADPKGEARLRWWDGHQWTDNVS